MPSESINTVFISSTFEDLREERAEVQKAVLRLGCLPMGMELFPSADDDAWGYIKGEIEKCDYYVLIVGGLYGSTDKDGISFTEKEYRLACELNKPRLVFVRSRRFPVGQDKIEQDDEKRKKLQAFVSELNNARLAQRFESLEGLGGQAYYSLNEARKRNPILGYVRVEDAKRAAEAGAKKALDEFAVANENLKSNNALLIQQNSGLNNEVVALRIALQSEVAGVEKQKVALHQQLTEMKETNLSLISQVNSLREQMEASQRSARDAKMWKPSTGIQKVDPPKPFLGYDGIVVPDHRYSPGVPHITVGLMFLSIVDEIKRSPNASFITVASTAEKRLGYQRVVLVNKSLKESNHEDFLLLEKQFVDAGLLAYKGSQFIPSVTTLGHEQYEILKALYRYPFKFQGNIS